MPGMPCSTYHTHSNVHTKYSNALRWKIMSWMPNTNFGMESKTCTKTTTPNVNNVNAVHAHKCHCLDGIGWKNSIFSPFHLHGKMISAGNYAFRPFCFLSSNCPDICALTSIMDLNCNVVLTWSTTEFLQSLSRWACWMCDWVPSVPWYENIVHCCYYCPHSN